MDENPDLKALNARLEEQEAAYAAALAELDALAGFPLPFERLPELPERIARLNALCQPPSPPDLGGLLGPLKRRLWAFLAPTLARQAEFDSLLVQLLNGYVDETALALGRLRTLASALIHYLQQVQPLMDLRDRAASGLATTRAELILEAFDRRQESLARRLQGLLGLRDRLEAVSEEVRAVRGALAAGLPPPAVAAVAVKAAEDSVYAAFENRFRGSQDEVKERLAPYAELFRGLAPVVDLGCGRGEFLEVLREQGIEARGVESNAAAVLECRRKGLEVSQGDLLALLGAQGATSLGGVFAAQVAEHLPPAALLSLLREAHRVLRPGGLLLLETVNPRSVVAFLEVYNRDLTHERPLHPDTLSFLAAAAGFGEVRVEMRSPVDAASRLREVAPEGLPAAVAEVLNENLARLNALLYGPQEYALIARR